MLEAGIKGHKEETVTNENTAKALGSGELLVYATPAMIALAENTALTSVADFLDKGQGTVGTKVDISHISATPVGSKVYCDTTLTLVDRRRLVFDVEVFDEAGKIGSGVHERFIVDNVKFQEKADKKREKI